MLIAFIADLHANLEATTAVLKGIDGRRPDRVVCLGDLTGYNAQPNEVIDLIRERNIPTIMGNHDAAVCGLEEPWFFRTSAQKAIEWQSERLWDDHRQWLAQASEQMQFDPGRLAVHGAPSSRDDYIVDWLDAMRQMQYLNGRDISLCFFGHSHRASFFSERGITPAVVPGAVMPLRSATRYFINPGSVGQPRDRDPRAAFGFLDTEKMTFEFCRVQYDIERCAKKIIEAGLPPKLAQRLSVGA